MSIDAWVERHPVFVYFVLTLLITWGSLLVVMGPLGMVGINDVPAERMTWVYVAMLLGPAIAGPLMIAWTDGRAGFADLLSRLRRWRVGAIWYAIAILTAPGLVTVSLLLLSPFSPAYVPTIFTTDDKAGMLVSGIVAGILVGVFEELGWTGFAIPRLRLSYGILASGLVLGLVWGLWHGPVFMASARASVGVPPIVALAVLLFTFLPAFRVLMVWVYDRTQSLPVAILMHASQTATTLILALSATDVEAVIFNLAYSALLWLFVGVVALANRGKLEAA